MESAEWKNLKSNFCMQMKLNLKRNILMCFANEFQQKNFHQREKKKNKMHFLLRF